MPIRLQPYSCAKSRTCSVRRSSISTHSTPPGVSQAAASANSARVASSPSGPLTRASRGSNSRTVGSSASYSASVRYGGLRSEEHTSELQSQSNLVCRLLLEKKKKQYAQLRDDDT